MRSKKRILPNASDLLEEFQIRKGGNMRPATDTT